MMHKVISCKECSRPIIGAHGNTKYHPDCFIISRNKRQGARNNRLYASDEKYRESVKKRAKDQGNYKYRTDSDYRNNKRKRASNYRNNNRDKVNQLARARYHKRYFSDPGFRSRKLGQKMNRYHKIGGHGYRSWIKLLLWCQDNTCLICNEPLSIDISFIDVDHIVPVSKGGSSDPSNLQATHISCNRSKRAS